MTIEINEDAGIVSVSDLEIENSSLASYLAQQEDSEYALIELINIALRIRSQFVTDLETQNISDAADSVIEEFDEKFAEAVNQLNEKFEELTDPKKGAIITNLDKITRDKLTNLLTPEYNPDDIANASPIALLRIGLTRDLKQLINDVQGPIDEIHAKLGLSGVVKKDTQAGDDFEDKVDAILQQFARTYGDTAEQVGTVAEMGRAKKGDSLITLNLDDTRGLVRKVAWEMKTEDKYKGDKKTQSRRLVVNQALTELNKVMDNRSSQVAVLVLDSDGLDMARQPVWTEFGGNKLVIITDRFAPNPELIQLAYLWSRWRARVGMDNANVTIDEQGIRDTISQIQQKIQLISNSKRTQTEAITSIKKSMDILTQYQNDTKDSFRSLASLINIEYEEIPENDEPATVTEIA